MIVNTKTFYQQFRLIARTNFFKNYIRRSYRAIEGDLGLLQQTKKFNRKHFTCLLSGVSGEITANEFISFTLDKNSQAHITVIDLGKEQTDAVRQLASTAYSQSNIEVRQGDLLKFNFPAQSFDWIETDVIMAYFPGQNLSELLKNWKKWLKDDGFITFRESAPDNSIENLIDQLKIIVARLFFGGRVVSHPRAELESTFSKAGFRFVSAPTGVPTLRRYCMVKK